MPFGAPTLPDCMCRSNVTVAGLSILERGVTPFGKLLRGCQMPFSSSASIYGNGRE